MECVVLLIICMLVYWSVYSVCVGRPPMMGCLPLRPGLCIGYGKLYVFVLSTPGI